LIKNIEDLSHIKITDFGVSVSQGACNEKDIIGSYYYIAPEVLDRDYDNKCDI